MGMSQSYGPADDAESVRTIRQALDLGVTLIDTADVYGDGHNEELIGRALGGHRDQAILAAKFSFTRDHQTRGVLRIDARADNVRRCCDASRAGGRGGRGTDRAGHRELR